MAKYILSISLILSTLFGSKSFSQYQRGPDELFKAEMAYNILFLPLKQRFNKYDERCGDGIERIFFIDSFKLSENEFIGLKLEEEDLYASLYKYEYQVNGGDTCISKIYYYCLTSIAYKFNHLTSNTFNDKLFYIENYVMIR